MSIPSQKEKSHTPIPQIVKTIFTIDKNKIYTFDVDENISFSNLKLMLKSALHLKNIGLRIFHEGQEYTSMDKETLQFLFPALNTIYFNLTLRSLSKSPEDYNSIVNINLCPKKNYCSLHNAKFTYYYCYTCKESICSTCLLSEKHKNHNFKEKYDYLQSSKLLIEEMCHNLNDGFEYLNKEYITEFKNKISQKFFNNIIQLVKTIEQKTLSLVDNLLENEKNIKKVKKNIMIFKKTCEEGIDILKDKISIEDMMLDENIFLMFDKKYNELNEEKEKMTNDINEYNAYKNQFKSLEDSIEKNYNEIFVFLQKYLSEDLFNNEDIYKENEKEIDNEENDFFIINTRTIFSHLFKDVKPNNIKYISTKRKREYNDNYYYNIEENYDYNENDDINTKITSRTNNNNTNSKTKNNKNNFITETANKIISKAKAKPKSKKKKKTEEKKETINNNNNNIDINSISTEAKSKEEKGKKPAKMALNKKSISHKSNSLTTQKICEQDNMMSNNNSEDMNTSLDLNLKYICHPVENTKEIIIYYIHEKKIEKLNFEYSSLTFGCIPSSCAWYNLNNYLYITGGILNMRSNQIFVRYNPEKNNLERLRDIPYGKEQHSICVDAKDNMYLVGGTTKIILKYGLKKGKWNLLKNELNISRRHPICLIHDEILYVFFGIDDNDNYINSYEKIDLKENKSELINTGDYHLVGGTYIDFGDFIYIFGGKNEKGVTNKSIKFNLSDGKVEDGDVTLVEPALFHQGKLQKIGESTYGNFSLVDHSFIKFNFN